MAKEYMTVDDMVQNIVDAWNDCTDQQKLDGADWYWEAHGLAKLIGRGNVRMGAGVIAALSPNKRWDINKRIALRTLDGDVSGHVGNAIAKATAIMQGTDPTEVLPMARKTGHFFMNIVDPSDPNWVTIDRHAYRVATCEWDNGDPHITVVMYRLCVEAYQRAAAILGQTPSTVQAATWVWARER
jgi:hypothetical protein